eukprot:TRINITY_DN6273_c0_g1_i1.p1 TRINITY_DN6273_c0_g1~~TRINITY_DN6273_c0_g1_i1.p1  ORF type:complete len:281 (+),score=57.07 TRINITY_DN6273_c0_g1_i1:127-843(+)
MGGVWAPKPSAGPHKTRECLPLVILLRNRLKYALTRREACIILSHREVKVDGKVRIDPNFPAGFMDVINVDATEENFRLLYDTKGRFVIHRISPEESTFKLAKVKKIAVGPKSIPYLATHDGRTIRYPHPHIKQNDTVKIDIKTGKITGHTKFLVGQLSMTTGGANTGRVGKITNIDKRLGGETIVHVKDSKGHDWSTLISNVFVIGEGDESLVSLPAGKGIRLSILEERALKLKSRE